MSRLIAEFTAPDGTPLEVHASSIKDFRFPNRKLYSFQDRDNPIQVSYAFSAKEKEPGIFLETKAEGKDVSVVKKLDEKRFCKILFHAIAEKFEQIHENAELQEIADEADDDLAEALMEKCGIVFNGTCLEGTGFLVDKDGDRVASFEDISFGIPVFDYSSEEAGITGKHAFGCLDTAQSYNGFFQTHNRWIKFENLSIVKKVFNEDSNLYDIILKTDVPFLIKSEDLPLSQSDMSKLPPFSEYAAVVDFVESRRAFLATINDSEDEIEDLDIDF